MVLTTKLMDEVIMFCSICKEEQTHEYYARDEDFSSGEPVHYYQCSGCRNVDAIEMKIKRNARGVYN